MPDLGWLVVFSVSIFQRYVEMTMMIVVLVRYIPPLLPCCVLCYSLSTGHADHGQIGRGDEKQSSAASYPNLRPLVALSLSNLIPYACS